MNTGKKYTYGLENESILVNQEGTPQYITNKQKTSNLIISIFNQRYPQYKNTIKPELDACQIELINSHPHTSIENASQEIEECLYHIENISKEFGLHISPNVAPKTEGPYSTSNAHTDDITKRYEHIGKTLEELGVRDSTNIAGLHINIGHKDKKKLLKLHKNISEYIYTILARGEIPLGMNKERYNQYIKVTKAIGENHFPILLNDYKKYIDEKGDPIKQGHTLVRLKRYSQYVTELRTPDAGTSPQDLYNKTQQQYELLSLFL